MWRGRRTEDTTDTRMVGACRRRLREYGLHRVSGIVELVDRVTATRARPVHLIPVHLRASEPCGVLLSTVDADFICYESNTSQHHQEHIIAHEIGHIICHHDTVGGPDGTTWGNLFPDPDPQLVRNILRRSQYSDAAEEEAEVIATIIMSSAARHAASAPTGAPRRFESALGFRRHW